MILCARVSSSVGKVGRGTIRAYTERIKQPSFSQRQEINIRHPWVAAALLNLPTLTHPLDPHGQDQNKFRERERRKEGKQTKNYEQTKPLYHSSPQTEVKWKCV